ncbi:MAG: glycosyltransferase family 39 protein [Nanoarchaeota archaeon]
MKIKKTLLVLFSILLIAFILRLIVAQTVEIVPDEIVYSLLPWKIISAQRLSTVEGGPLFSYLTDLGFILFGEVNATSTRFPSIFFGSLTVILIYLCSLKIFQNKKAALFSSFLFALSGFALENNTESDMVAFFFAFLSMYFFLSFLEGKRIFLYPSVIFLALGVLCKDQVLIFLPGYLVAFLLTQTEFYSPLKKIKLEKDLFKTFLGCLTIGALLLTPLIAYNYLEFKNNGKTDDTVSTLLGIGENFHAEYQLKSWDFSKLRDFIFRSVPSKFFSVDPLIMVLGLIGIILTIRQKNLGIFLLAFSLFFLVGYIGGINPSSSHYLWVPLILSLFAGYTVEKVSSYLGSKFNLRWASVMLVLIIAVVSSFQFQAIISKESANMELREYSIENIPKDSIVVMDPRIYFGSYSWVLHGRHYLNGLYFQELLTQMGGSAAPKMEVPLYYIECSGDSTCGWKQEDYDRVNLFAESLSGYFKDNLAYTAEIKANHRFLIYKGFISVPPTIYQSIDRTHVFWGASIGWKYPDLNIDEYSLQGSNKIFHMIGLLFLYLNLLLALLTIPLVLVLLFRSEK